MRGNVSLHTDKVHSEIRCPAGSNPGSHVRQLNPCTESEDVAKQLVNKVPDVIVFLVALIFGFPTISLMAAEKQEHIVNI